MKLRRLLAGNGITTIILLLVGFIVFISPVEARRIEGLPQFPSCPDPDAALKVHFDEGWHWIVGYPKLQWGSDSVFFLDNDNYVQCFCPKKPLEGENDCGGGIQTNWLKASNVENTAHEWLLDHGWIVVESGEDFGLASEKYFAKNRAYSCKGDQNSIIIQANKSKIHSSVSIYTNSGNNSVSETSGGNTSVELGSIMTNVTIRTTVRSNSITLTTD